MLIATHLPRCGILHSCKSEAAATLWTLFPYFNRAVMTRRGNHSSCRRLCQSWDYILVCSNRQFLVLSYVPQLQGLHINLNQSVRHRSQFLFLASKLIRGICFATMFFLGKVALHLCWCTVMRTKHADGSPSISLLLWLLVRTECWRQLNEMNRWNDVISLEPALKFSSPWELRSPT